MKAARFSETSQTKRPGLEKNNLTHFDGVIYNHTSHTGCHENRLFTVLLMCVFKWRIHKVPKQRNSRSPKSFIRHTYLLLKQHVVL